MLRTFQFHINVTESSFAYIFFEVFKTRGAKQSGWQEQSLIEPRANVPTPLPATIAEEEKPETK
tara:strand:- start:52 stop:243 length:192 start_codon:yes stop_codon:yes gene_type:complete